MNGGRVGPSPSPVERRVWEAGTSRDAALAPGARREHGVVHTPPAICRFLLERADQLLVRAHGRSGGLADPAVALVDPACGPGAFFAAALTVAGDRSSRPALLLGIDRDPAALERAAAALRPEVDGWPLELRAGDALERLEPIEGAETLVVIGNPPWAGRSASRAALTEGLLDDFRRDATGAPLGERKIGVLSDAYVRFLRWAAEVVRRAPAGGIVAFALNGSFLDGPVHRGMRAALARYFDQIELVDLGGSALIAREPGARDENVFGVRPNVVLFVGSRLASRNEATPASLRYLRLRGRREAKLERLGERLELEPIEVSAPWRPSTKGAALWPEGWRALPELFPFHREGVQTNRDAFVTDTDRERLVARLQAFALDLKDPRVDIRSLARSHFDPERARAALREALLDDPEATGLIEVMDYRPFERRHFVTHGALCHRSRAALRAAVRRSELTLATTRKDRGERPWAHVAVTASVPDNCFFSTRSSCRARAFPSHLGDGTPNLSLLGAVWAEGSGPAWLLRYVLAWLSSDTYRRRFASMLALDYPRVPPPGPHAARFVEVGEAIAAAYLEGPSRETTRLTIGHFEVEAPAALAEAHARADALVLECWAAAGGPAHSS